MAKWIEAQRQEGNSELAAKFHISPMTARLIRNRGVKSEEEMQEYLFGDLKDLHSSFLMKGMEEAVRLILHKIEKNVSIRIIGDYDIDGVNATHILLTGLERLGAKVDTVIPERLKDGYGLNENLILAAHQEGIDTIITCDNGIAAMTEIAYGKKLGMTILVTDHHEVPYLEKEDGTRTSILPPADVILNPKQKDCPYPFKKLCGAAVAYKFVEALYAKRGISLQELHELIEFVAVATVGDIMELSGENRIFVKYGLKSLEHTKNLGYRALLDINGLSDKKLTGYHIGFVIGPCINASGRLDTARRALNLLNAGTQAEAEKLAGDLKALNDERKDLTAQGTEKAYQLIDSTNLKEDKVLVVYIPECHESLAGIIAGRIKEKYHKPCFVLTRGEEGIKGSGRSIESYHMFEEMTKVKNLFTKYGGHPMAAGLSLPEERVEEFRKSINEICTLTQDDFDPRVTFDAVLHLQYAGEQLLQEIALLEPFGCANEKPVFVETGIKVLSARIIGKNQNVLKLNLQNKDMMKMEAVYFGEVQQALSYIESKDTISITYYPDVNEYMGKRTVQIVVRNFR